MAVRTVDTKLDARDRSFGVIVSRWNDVVTRSLLDGALDALRRHGADDSNITVVWVPGSFEVPVAAFAMAQSAAYDALVAIGCVIRGETSHHEHIASAVTSGIAHVALTTGVPVGFGVLTVDNLDQAIARAGSKGGNKGAEAALAAVEMAAVLAALRTTG